MLENHNQHNTFPSVFIRDRPGVVNIYLFLINNSNQEISTFLLRHIFYNIYHFELNMEI
jgi:hypothetical protein